MIKKLLWVIIIFSVILISYKLVSASNVQNRRFNADSSFRIQTQLGNYFVDSYEFNKQGTCISLDTKEIICGFFIITPATQEIETIIDLYSRDIIPPLE